MKLMWITLDINEVGGVGRVISSLANYFVEKFNYEIEIISLFESANKTRYFKFNDRIKFKYLNIDDSRNGKLNKILKYKEMINKIKIELVDNEYDIVMTFNTMVSICLCLNKKFIKGKFIATEHGDYYHFGKAWRCLRRLLYKNIDQLVVLTNKDKNIYKKFLNNVQSIPNPIPFKSEEIISVKEKSIISVGRLEEDKGFEYIITAFENIVKLEPDWVLNIIGEGSKEIELKELIRTLNLENNVFIKPFTPKIKNEYLENSIYCLTSKTEAFPMVLLEAMECGLPCISFDIAGPKEIIKNNEDGFIVEQYNNDELVKKILTLVKDEKLRANFSENAKKNIQRYSIENICNIWNELFYFINDRKKY